MNEQLENLANEASKEAEKLVNMTNKQIDDFINSLDDYQEED